MCVWFVSNDMYFKQALRVILLLSMGGLQPCYPKSESQAVQIKLLSR